MTGVLVLVGTPIGNMGDLSPRAAEALAAADLICCEDTRRTGLMLDRIGVKPAQLRRVDEHTELAVSGDICRLLDRGATVVVVTDGGMPGISDPGQRLADTAIEAGHTVTTVPGPSAGVAALAVSGLPTARWVFEGFLPRAGARRATRLAEIARERRTVVLYESPHRLRGCLTDLAETCGEGRRAVVARELTKLHEEVVRATLAELGVWADNSVKGEVVIVVEGAEPEPEPGDGLLTEAVEAAVSSGASRRDAAAEVAEVYGVSRRRTYALALGLKGTAATPTG